MKKLILLVAIVAALASAPPVRERIAGPTAGVLERVAPLLGDAAAPIRNFLARRDARVIAESVARELQSNHPVPRSERGFQTWVAERLVSREGGVDPWGMPYFLTGSEGSLTVGSSGADRKRGTADDVLARVEP